jgi:pimeloyl-[acyl-carrier protein] methyl ester esterase
MRADDTAVARLHVESSGRGTPLVLLHGWALHAGLFAPLLADLTPRHRVHAVDLPGHGHSAPLVPWTIEGVVRALERAFGDADDAVDVLGWSLGGTVALAWALAHPRRIRRLVLVATTPKFVAADDWPHAMSRETLRRFADELRVAYRLTLQRFVALQVQGSEDARATLAALRNELFARGAPDGAVLHGALDTLATTDLRAEVARIETPTLVIGGDRDALVPLAASRWLAGTLRHARLATIKGAGHAPFLSHRSSFAAAIQAFLRNA